MEEGRGNRGRDDRIRLWRRWRWRFEVGGGGDDGSRLAAAQMTVHVLAAAETTEFWVETIEWEKSAGWRWLFEAETTGKPGGDVETRRWQFVGWKRQLARRGCRSAEMLICGGDCCRVRDASWGCADAKIPGGDVEMRRRHCAEPDLKRKFSSEIFLKGDF